MNRLKVFRKIKNSLQRLKAKHGAVVFTDYPWEAELIAIDKLQTGRIISIHQAQRDSDTVCIYGIVK